MFLVHTSRKVVNEVIQPGMRDGDQLNSSSFTGSISNNHYFLILTAAEDAHYYTGQGLYGLICILHLKYFIILWNITNEYKRAYTSCIVK